MTYKLIVLDLDDTLLDTTNLLIPIKDSPLFETKIREPLPLLPGAKNNLDYLKTKYTLILLTQGRPHFQKLKIKSLDIESYFTEIKICDPSNNENKAQYFKRIMNDSNILPKHLLSIGNRRSTDLAPAKDLGWKTCWFCYGEHKEEPIQRPEENPDFIVYNHFEMIETCHL